MNIKKDKIKIGADPEIFLLKDEKPYSAIGTISGTKEKPQLISDQGHSVQVDNVLLEFNIPPSASAEKIWEDIDFVMKWFRNNFTKEYTFKISSSEVFDKNQLTHPDSQRFGCDPDYNVWTEDVNASPSPDTNVRSAGGHIHISYLDANIDTSLELIKLFDLFLGVPSVLIDKDKRRRRLYGKAGAFRFKNYAKDVAGFEYRVLSNFWIKDLKSVRYIYGQIEKAIDSYNNGIRIERISDEATDIINCINNSDEALAKKLIKKYNI